MLEQEFFVTSNETSITVHFKQPSYSTCSMGVTSSSRFRADAEFLLKGNSNIMRLEQLMAKKAHRILDGNYNILVRLCEEGHFDALRCALNLSRCASAV